MTTKLISERVHTPFAGCRVDVAAGIIFGAKLCGVNSVNGRDYPPAVFRSAIGKYEGIPVYADHGTARTVAQKMGWVQDARVDADGTPRGDLHLLLNHSLTPQVLEAAERNPTLFGCSHVALCKTGRGSPGRERVEAIDRAESVDIVPEPATTRGFFESTGGGPAMPTIRTFLESWAGRFDPDKQRRVRKLLVEADDLPGSDAAAVMDAPMDAPADDAEPDDALWAGFQDAISKVLEQYAEDHDAAAAIKAIKKYLKAHAKLAGGGDIGDAGDDEPAEESRRRAATELGLIRESIDACRRVGFKGFDADDLEALAAVPPARRESLARRLMGATAAAGAERPESAGRHQSARLAEERQAASHRVAEGRDGAAKAEEPMVWVD